LCLAYFPSILPAMTRIDVDISAEHIYFEPLYDWGSSIHALARRMPCDLHDFNDDIRLPRTSHQPIRGHAGTALTTTVYASIHAICAITATVRSISYGQLFRHASVGHTPSMGCPRARLKENAHRHATPACDVCIYFISLLSASTVAAASSLFSSSLL
jgi:hypothetical protein